MRPDPKNYVIPRTDLCMSEAMPFNQHWEARISVPIADIKDMGNALQSAVAVMKPGDLLNVCSFANHNWDRLMETAQFRIVSGSQRRVLAVQVTDTVKVPEDVVLVKASEVLKLSIEKIGNSWQVKDSRGSIVEVFVEEKQATEFVAREEAKMLREIDKKIDKTGWTVNRGLAGKFIVKNKAGEPIREFLGKAEAEAYLEADKVKEPA